MTFEEFATKAEDLLAEYNFSLKKGQDREEFIKDFYLELQAEVSDLDPIDEEESEDSEEEESFEEDDF
jgi:hypothetical protein